MKRPIIDPSIKLLDESHPIQSPLDESHPIQVPIIKGFEKNTQIFETHLNWIHWIRQKRPYKWRTLHKDTITHED